MIEVWKDIQGYEGLYQVSNFGRVKSLARDTKNQYAFQDRIIKQSDDKNGYKIVGLSGKTFKVHRLVANAFIEKVIGKELINHKDGNKQNNCIDNLEWCTNSENTIHALENKLFIPKKGNEHPCCKSVVLKDDKYTIKFKSLIDASKFLGVGKTAVSNCLNGRSKSCKGYEVYYG